MATSDARTAILDSAEALFARHGFAATTIKQIGAEAGLNPALLYYYFPDKQRLYQAVLERRMGVFARQAPVALPEGVAPLEGIRRLLHAQVAFLRETPYVPRLLARELADHEASNVRPVLQQLSSGAFRMLCDLIRAGQRDGSIRADMDPDFTAISIISQCAWFFVAESAVSRILGYNGAVPAREVNRFAEHAFRFAAAALTPPEATVARPRAARKRARS